MDETDETIQPWVISAIGAEPLVVTEAEADGVRVHVAAPGWRFETPDGGSYAEFGLGALVSFTVGGPKAHDFDAEHHVHLGGRRLSDLRAICEFERRFG